MEEFRKNALNRAKEFSLESVLPMYEKIYHQVTSK
jgi:hypothetical protein